MRSNQHVQIYPLDLELQGADAGGVSGGVLIVLMFPKPGEAGVDELCAEGDSAPAAPIPAAH